MVGALLEDLLGRGIHARVRVTGASMGRAVRSGDVVILAPLAGPAARGDLVMYRNAGGDLVLHRVLRLWRDARGNARYQTRGDANLRLDAVVAGDRILGRVAAVERRGAQIVDLTTATARRRAHAVALAHLAVSGLVYKLARALRHCGRIAAGLSGPATHRRLTTDR